MLYIAYYTFRVKNCYSPYNKTVLHSLFLLFSHLSSKIPLHHLLYRLIVIAAAEKIIELRDGCLRRHVVSAHCPRAGEAAAGLIGAEVDCPLRAL